MPPVQDREKALESALAQIEKNHGKGSVMRLGDTVRPPIGVIPTGSIALDVALGIGGLPRGRVVEIYGPESSGKCLTADTYVWSDHGLETIAELFERAGSKATCTSRITDVRDLALRAVNERGELEEVAALTHNNRKPVLRFVLESGRTVSVTHNHPLRVVSERGFMVWRRAGELQVGDTLVSAAFGAVEAAAGDGLSEDEAVFLGYLAAEGSLGQRRSVTFTDWDPEVGGEYVQLAESLFGRVAVYGDVRGDGAVGKEFRVHSKAFREMLAERYGLHYGNADTKTIPLCVRTAGHKAQRAFLSALFEGDGWIDDHSSVGLGTASRELAEQVQLLLLGLGVPAGLYVKDGGAETPYADRQYWTVGIGPASAHRFLDEVGFRSQRRASQVAAHFRRSSRTPQVENVPHLAGLIRDLRDDLGGDREFDRIAHDLFRPDLSQAGSLDCSRSRLADLVAWARAKQPTSPTGRAVLGYLEALVQHAYTFERIVAVEDAGLQPTFDLMVPATHSFLANGVLSHNTSLALHAIANAQAAGGIAAIIDAEHALDPDYAKKLGVDTDALLVSQPDTGEQALEIADMLIRSGSLDIIVIDSVAALVPRAEIEGEMGDSHVGLQARLMSQALRKMTGAISNTNTTAIFINQLREKIGVLFGCLAYGTRVTLADGSQEKIGKIVNQRMPVEVLSYDPDQGRIVPKKIVNWFDNGTTDEFLQVTVARPGGNGRAQLAVTPNHQISTPGGWREAGELMAGDRVLLSEAQRLSDQQWQSILGGLMGDGKLSPSRVPGSLGTRYRMGHGAAQHAYLDWKAGLLGNIGQSRTVNAKGAAFVDLTPLPELAELRATVYQGDGKKHLSHDYLKALTPLSLAIWYCDDGSFTLRAKGMQERTVQVSGRCEICIEAMSPGSRQRLLEHLAGDFDLHPTLSLRGVRQKAVLTFAKDETTKLHELVAPYVHPSMDYKLLPRLRGRLAVQPEFTDPVLVPVPAVVREVKVKPPTRSMRRFDIEVEGSHNYLADGVIVHNSPETTTGGKALKFYASVRLDIRRIETIKDGTEAVGNKVRVKVVKNKCLAAGTTVFDPVTGLTHDIADIADIVAQRQTVHVVAADKSGRLHTRPVTAWLDQGEQDVATLRLRGGAEITATLDHLFLTDRGWVQLADLRRGDRVAQPRHHGGFGDVEPVTAEQARLLGYLIGDGYAGGKTPVTFINISEPLVADAAGIARTMGCEAHRQPDKLAVSFSHRPGERNGVLELCRWAGIWGHLAPERRLPAAFFDPGLAEPVAANLLFGLFESNGWVSQETTGALRVGYITTSIQLAHQLRWLLLRWGVSASVRRYHPTSKRPSLIKGRRVQGRLPVWELRVSGSDNVRAFAAALPCWGPHGSVLQAALAQDEGRWRGSQQVYLGAEHTAPVLEHLRNRGLTPVELARLLGEPDSRARADYAQLLGRSVLRRDRLAQVAAALDDAFLRDVLDEQVSFASVRSISPTRRAATYDVEVEELHTLVADHIVVHNCSPPFKQAEFEIEFGRGISREGSLIDLGVEHGMVRKSGAWYTYEGDQLGQGKENAKAFLRDNPDLADEIDKRIKEKLGIGAVLDADTSADAVVPLPAPVDF